MYDVIIVGAGLAGLTTALSLPNECQILLISKQQLSNCSSYKAQGGIAAALAKTDDFNLHINDTLVAGAGLCDKNAVKFIIERGPQAIDWLLSQGASFTTQPDGSLHLTREGGHSQRRVAHAADATGLAITSRLQQLVLNKNNITLIENAMVIDLLITKTASSNSCTGIKLLEQHQITNLSASTVVLACGGVGQLFPHTTNPSIATGDGVALAWRAGCRIANLEFIQFHPSALKLAGAPCFLISEALRGEGALLKRADASRFMPDYDQRAELAPRDIVARAIAQEMQTSANNCVYLDIRHKGAEFIHQHFPTISQECLAYGLDITQQPIPIAPAAHYSCGGVMTDLTGQTDVTGLYAIGETAYTGLHGANRLASNSLLECVVMAQAAVANIVNGSPATRAKIIASLPVKTIQHGQLEPCPAPLALAMPTDEQLVSQLQQLMWHSAGIIRQSSAMQTALQQVAIWRANFVGDLDNSAISSQKLELKNLLDVAWLLLSSALSRHESRGLHTTTDYPTTEAIAQVTALTARDNWFEQLVS